MHANVKVILQLLITDDCLILDSSFYNCYVFRINVRGYLTCIGLYNSTTIKSKSLIRDIKAGYLLPCEDNH